MMSSEMGNMMGGMGMPPMRGMEMPGLSMQMPSGLSFEEMSSMPPTAASTGGKPEYTVTSPPMSPPSPAETSIKLNGNELIVEASHSGEEFKQKHIIPDNIDLDLMSSSFSSDGILVIKAPKKA